MLRGLSQKRQPCFIEKAMPSPVQAQQCLYDIRIEDDLLITEDGCEVLSKDIIKDPDEIEAFMA